MSLEAIVTTFFLWEAQKELSFFFLGGGHVAV